MAPVETFRKMSLPLYKAGFMRFALVAAVATNAAMALGAFFGTLRLQQKISKRTGALLNIFCYTLIFAD